jgi:hypothetical protein
MGEGRQAIVRRPLNGFDFCIGYYSQAVPPLPQDAHQPSCLTHFETTQFIHGPVQEEISREHRDNDQVWLPGAPGPDLDLRQKDMEAFRCELAVDHLLTMAARVKRVPMTNRRALRFRLQFEMRI